MKILGKNKEALLNYEVLETFIAGIVLEGSEVKSLKAGHFNFKGAYVSVEGGEIFLKSFHISPYRYARNENYDPEKQRKLLLTKKEINYLLGKVREKGITLIPLEVFSERNLIKVKIGLCRGRKLYDKRRILKEKAIQREAEQTLKKLKF